MESGGQDRQVILHKRRKHMSGILKWGLIIVGAFIVLKLLNIF